MVGFWTKKSVQNLYRNLIKTHAKSWFYFYIRKAVKLVQNQILILKKSLACCALKVIMKLIKFVPPLPLFPFILPIGHLFSLQQMIRLDSWQITSLGQSVKPFGGLL